MKDLLPAGLVLWAVLSWVTHIVTCIKTSSWILLIVGAIFFPIGNIHGTGVWFGVF